MSESANRELDAVIAAYDALRRRWEPGSSRTPMDVDDLFRGLDDVTKRLRLEIERGYGSYVACAGGKDVG
jgi:hypothetical protein